MKRNTRPTVTVAANLDEEATALLKEYLGVRNRKVELKNVTLAILDYEDDMPVAMPLTPTEVRQLVAEHALVPSNAKPIRITAKDLGLVRSGEIKSPTVVRIPGMGFARLYMPLRNRRRIEREAKRAQMELAAMTFGG